MQLEDILILNNFIKLDDLNIYLNFNLNLLPVNTTMTN